MDMDLVPTEAESVLLYDEYLINELEAEIGYLRAIIRGIMEKKRIYNKKFIMEQLRWIRVLNNFRKRLAEKETQLEKILLLFHSGKIEANDYDFNCDF